MSFKTFCIVVLVALCAVFFYLRIRAAGPEDSSFNRSMRWRLGKSSTMRSLLSLHRPGDARADFLAGTKSIAIEVVQPQGDPLGERVILDFAAQVEEYTGKQVQVFTTDTIAGGNLTEVGIAEIVSRNRRHLDAGVANLFVIYADNFSAPAEQLSTTYREFGMVLSHERLKALSRQYPVPIEQYQAVSLLHEFGRQMGLAYNDNEDCVMRHDIEVPQVTAGFFDYTPPLKFCAQELQELEAIKKVSR